MTADLPLVLPLVAPALLRSVDPAALISGGGAFVVTLNKQPVTLSGQKITIKKVS